MATQPGAADEMVSSGPDWPSAAVAGLFAALLVGVVVSVGFDAAIIEESIPGPVGLSGFVAGWVILLAIGLVVGVVYGALNAIEAIDALASTPRTGALLGLAYGLVLWAIAVVTVPLLLGDGVGGIGDYAVTGAGVLSYALLGVIVGFMYLLIPVLRGR